MHCHISFKKCNVVIACFWLLLSVVRCNAETLLLNADIHSWALETIACLYNEQYKEAEATAAKIIKKYPYHPAGYFFSAVVIDSWMSSHLSNKREDDFYNYCELAEGKAEKLLDKNPHDEWAQFFLGGAEGYKGTYELRYERWISAGRHGWKGVSILKNLRDQKSEIPDLEYGIGSYEYWRCALTKRLWWMPRVQDKRAEGIEKLLRVQKNGIYTKASASISLIDIYLNEKRYADALAIAAEAEQQYPNCKTFIFGKIQALFGLNKFEESEEACRQALSREEADSNNEHASIEVCHLWIAKIDSALGLYTECIAECDIIKKYRPGDDTRELLEQYISEAEDIKEWAIIARKNGLLNQQAAKK